MSSYFAIGLTKACQEFLFEGLGSYLESDNLHDKYFKYFDNLKECMELTDLFEDLRGGFLDMLSEEEEKEFKDAEKKCSEDYLSPSEEVDAMIKILN